MQPEARRLGPKPAFFTRHEHGTARCFVGPGWPDVMNRAMPGSLLGHAGRHSPARHFNVGLVAARWLPRPVERSPSSIYSPKPNSQFPAAAPEPMNASLPQLARVRNASPSLVQPRMLPSPSLMRCIPSHASLRVDSNHIINFLQSQTFLSCLVYHWIS